MQRVQEAVADGRVESITMTVRAAPGALPVLLPVLPSHAACLRISFLRIAVGWATRRRVPSLPQPQPCSPAPPPPLQVGTQRRAVLEAVAYGCFLRDVESWVDSEYELLTPVAAAGGGGFEA